jgi:cyanophycinase-like exopeptidase
VEKFVIGVHFTASNALPDVLEAMRLTHTPRALGIDDGACAVFENGIFAGTLGQTVYDITMTDFGDKTHRISVHTTLYSR